MTLIGSKGSEHCMGVTKGFLNFLAGLARPRIKSAKQLYCNYMSAYLLVGSDINLNSFNRWSEGQAKFYTSMYGTRNKGEPKNFDAKNQHDVSRMAQMLSLNIVIYHASTEEGLEALCETNVLEDPAALKLDLFHDYSAFYDLEADADVRHVSFVITPRSRIYSVLNCASLGAQVGWSVARMISSERACLLPEVGLGETLCRLLEVDDSFASSPVLSRLDAGSKLIFGADDQVLSQLGRLERPLVIAVYTRRGKAGGRVETGGAPSRRAVFEIIFKSESLNYASSGLPEERFRLPARDEIDILVLIGGLNLVVLPREEWASRIYSLLSLLPAEDKLDTAYLFSGLAPGKDFEDRLREKRRAAQEKRNARYGRKEGKKKQRMGGCECVLCRNSLQEYEFNMNEDGPERLLTVGFSCVELLRLLGMDTAANLSLVNSLVQHSVAAFDIESKTLPVDAETPDASQYRHVDPHMSVEGHFQKVQRPIMVAHMDLLDGEGEPQVWRVTGDSETESYRMMQDYFHAVLARQRRAEAVKLRKCGDLLGVKLADWRARTRGFFEERFREVPPTEEEANSGSGAEHFDAAYRSSLMGQLEVRLRKLCRLYVVFSFYGSGYDHVLLFGHLAPLWYEKKLRPRIERRGNKVTAVTLRGHLLFRDITKMLAPGTNLRSFGKLFGLEQEKAHFPFALLTSVAVLDRPELPEDEESWRNDLGSGSATPQEIAEAKELFARAGCRNLGDYLQAYLRLDVVVLFKAVLLWRRSLIEVIGADFVEAGKFTISSLSNYAGTQCQAERLRVGSFFPNNRRHYGLLRRGMRG